MVKFIYLCNNYTKFKTKDLIVIKKDMIEKFGITRKTLNNWENNEKLGRYLLYKTLEAIPLEYIENVEKQINEQIDNNNLLNIEDVDS